VCARSSASPASVLPESTAIIPTRLHACVESSPAKGRLRPSSRAMRLRPVHPLFIGCRRSTDPPWANV
jgi:hypothetical protein